MSSFLGRQDIGRRGIEHMLAGSDRGARLGILPKHFDAIMQDPRDHFAREERAMTEARVPVLLCHLELHAQIVSEVAALRREIVSRDPVSGRDLIDAVLPELIANHIATADAVSARFLRA